MKDILELSDYQKLNLFAYIESSATQSVSVQEIQDEFELTYFKATSMMNGLIRDFEQLEMDAYFYIEKSNGTYVYKKSGLDSINRLIWMYGRRSLKFNLLHYLLKNPDSSIEKFSEDIFISLTKGYKVKNELAIFLKNYQIEHLFPKTRDEEFKIRLVLAQLYYYIFKDYELPFVENDIVIAEGIMEQLKLSQYCQFENHWNQVFLKYYLIISIERSSKGYSGYDGIISDSQALSQFQEIDIFRYLKNEKLRMAEKKYLYRFLVAQNWLKGSREVSKLPSQLTAEILVIFKESYQTQNQKTDFLSQTLEAELIQIIYRYHSFGNLLIDGFFYTSLKAFKESYYELYLGTNGFIAQLQKRKIVNNIVGHKTFFMEILMLVLKHFNLDDFIPGIVVTVNFSIGEHYNEFIKTTLRSLPLANMEITENYSERTDIYLSDVLSREINSKYIIWNSPPTPADWEVFGNLVARVKGEKI